jgi:ComF family protein
MLKNILDWIFPKKCISCGTEGRFICRNCFSKIRHSDKPFLSFPETEGIIKNYYIPCRYHGNDVLKKAVHLMKYRFYMDISEEISELFVDLFKKHPPPENSLLVPIPLNKNRYKYRGFNQAYQLSRHISLKCGLPMADMLIRTKETKQQAESTRAERLKNLKNAFEMGNHFISRGHKIILVDDICTTLSTLKEAALTLQKNGYKIIFSAALARAEIKK